MPNNAPSPLSCLWGYFSVATEVKLERFAKIDPPLICGAAAGDGLSTASCPKDSMSKWQATKGVRGEDGL